VSDLWKLIVFLAAAYGAYEAVRTAWRLGNDLLG
jgi:hypothetical protein